MNPLRVGVVGAGPWAHFVHAPMLALHPNTTLVGVWARRPEATKALADQHGVMAFDSFDALVDQCEAVAFAVPPNVQATLAARAAAAGRAVLLDKPIALDLEGAQRLADSVGEAGVGSQIVLSWRYMPAVRSFLEDVSAEAGELGGLLGGRGAFVAGALEDGPFSTPWRVTHGHLLDLGPHVLDLLDAALGRVVALKASGDPHRWTSLLLEHEGGATSVATMSATSRVTQRLAGAEAYSAAGGHAVDTSGGLQPTDLVTIVDEFVSTARGAPHPLDVHRGLHLQRLLQAASDDLART